MTHKSCETTSCNKTSSFWGSWCCLILEPWGVKCIFKQDPRVFQLCWASNPGAMTHLFACWKEHSSLAPRMQLAMLAIADCVFQYLDCEALRVKHMLAAEVMRLEAESDDEHVQLTASMVSQRYPEIRAIHEWWKGPQELLNRIAQQSGITKVSFF